MCVQAHTWRCVQVYTVCVHECIYVHKYVCLSVSAYMYVYTIYVYACMYIYSHVYMHVSAHTCVCM